MSEGVFFLYAYGCRNRLIDQFVDRFEAEKVQHLLRLLLIIADMAIDLHTEKLVKQQIYLNRSSSITLPCFCVSHTDLSNNTKNKAKKNFRPLLDQDLHKL